MFHDKKLRQFFNSDDDKKFVLRLLHLAKNLEFDHLSIDISPIRDDCFEYVSSVLNDHINRRNGKIYIAYNTNNPELIKIGRTSKSTIEREKSLNSVGVIGEIKIVGWCETPDTVMTETFIHQRLKAFNTEKEFFNIPMKEASVVINECSLMTTEFYNRIFTYYGG